MTTGLTLVPTFAAAVIVFAAAYMRPRLFWPLVITCAVVASGLVIEQISYIDELLVGWTVLGVALRSPSVSGRRFGRTSRRPDRVHLLLFLVTCGYMALQSLRGMLITDSAQKIRWIFFFGLVAALAVAMDHGKRPMPRWREAAILLSGAGLAYFVAYFTVGWATEGLAGGSRYDIQNLYWGGTTYAAFAIVAVIPAAVRLLRDNLRSVRALAWLTVGAIIWQSFYYDSRISWESLIVLLILGTPVMGVRRAFVFAGGLTIALWLFLTFFWPAYYTLGTFQEVLSSPGRAIWGPTEALTFSDLTRYAHTQIGFDLLGSSTSMFFIGTGFRASDPLVGPALVAYYMSHGLSSYAGMVQYQASTVGLTTLLIETGSVGVALYLANFGMVVRGILRAEKSAFRYTLLGALGLTALWTLVTNPIDILLFHLIIMPSGLLLLLTSANDDTQAPDAPSPATPVNFG